MCAERTIRMHVLQAAILPVAPTAEQVQYCSGDTSTLWQRLGVSLLLTLVTLKTTALAAGSFTFPLWYPSLRAALRNRSIKGKYRCNATLHHSSATHVLSPICALPASKHANVPKYSCVCSRICYSCGVIIRPLQKGKDGSWLAANMMQHPPRTLHFQISMCMDNRHAMQVYRAVEGSCDGGGCGGGV